MLIINKDLAKSLPTEQVVTLELLRTLATDHPDLVAKALTAHDEIPSDDPHINIMKIAALSKERGNFFDDDFARLAEKEAHYFDIKGVMDQAKELVDKGKKTFVNAYVPGAGDMAVNSEHKSKAFIKDLIGRIFNKKGNSDITDNNPNASRLRNHIVGDPNDKPPAKEIIPGLENKYFWGGIIVIVLLFIVILVIVKINKNKKEENKK